MPNSAAWAQDEDHAHGASGGMAMCETCPPPRASSGTSWQPDLSGVAHPWRQWGNWAVGTHLEVALTAINETGPRGDSAVVAPNHGMLNLRRSLGGGTFGIRSMWSLDPLMGAAGYPLLLQSGESADDINPLVDRQHPHDFFMELAATYERSLNSGATLSLYLGAVGEPALGPPAFMHRPSGSLLPTAPITHHWFDSTHITQGVFTVGFAPQPHVRFEGSVFRGKESDRKRWGLGVPTFDSFSLRVSVNPSESLAIQASAGVLKDPEVVHPFADVTRASVSVAYAGRWEGAALDALAAVGHMTRAPSVYPVDNGYYYGFGATSPAVLLEGTLAMQNWHRIIVRAEAVRKGELFPLADPRHGDQFPVARATFGYAVRLPLGPAMLDVGGAWSAVRVGDRVKPDYDGNQRGYLGFIRMTAH